MTVPPWVLSRRHEPQSPLLDDARLIARCGHDIDGDTGPAVIPMWQTVRRWHLVVTSSHGTVVLCVVPAG